MKLGKTFLFWGLEPNVTVSVVGLSKPKNPYNNLESICEDGEFVRIAAAGK